MNLNSETTLKQGKLMTTVKKHLNLLGYINFYYLTYIFIFRLAAGNLSSVSFKIYRLAKSIAFSK